MPHTLSNSTFYDGSELSHRSSTIPRSHRRHMSSESAFVISSRDCSPIRRRSPVYCSGSLPRSTHSIPAASTQSKVQRTIPNKHIINEQNRLVAKSGEICRSPRKFGTLDNRLSVERERHYRTLNSGPSSYESGKASGPSSFDSNEKVSYSRTSGHSSLDSHGSSSAGKTQTTATTATSTASMANRITHFNGNSSPKFSPKHQLSKSKFASESPVRMKSASSSASTATHRADDMPILGKPPLGIPNSNSNNSITLQVTTSSESHMPNTKIFVQNSPVRSVITLENGKLTDNSNVYIINNETTTNGDGELIKRSVSKQQSSPLKARTTKVYRNENDCPYSETDFASETGDSLSFISETSPESSMMPTPTPEPFPADALESTKFTKNVNNDATMNNGRKFSLPVTSSAPNNIVYKNVLKNVNDASPTSPPYNKNMFAGDDFEDDKLEAQAEHTALRGSFSNLRFIEKNEKFLNSNATQYESNGKLNSSPAINTDSIAHMLHKNMTAVGSEPNLTVNNAGDIKQKLISDKAVEKESVGRRLSVSKENGNSSQGNELYNFPSLSDLSFNFTSLAAQKILQGVSINSIDTLVELNMAQDKQQNNVSATAAQPQAICTDYGLV